MNKLLILISLILISCNSNNESYNECEVTYRILIKENAKYNSYLKENIQNEIKESSNNKVFVKYDSLTQNYLNYLSEIEAEIVNKTAEIFFENDKYSDRGKEFINKTKEYKSEIEKIIESPNLKKRINLVLNTNDLHQPDIMYEIADNNETNEFTVDKINIYYLHYYYKGFPKYQSLAFLNNKRRSILEIENEFITNSNK